jgi:hypothetical protein
MQSFKDETDTLRSINDNLLSTFHSLMDRRKQIITFITSAITNLNETETLRVDFEESNSLLETNPLELEEVQAN